MNQRIGCGCRLPSSIPRKSKHSYYENVYLSWVTMSIFAFSTDLCIALGYGAIECYYFQSATIKTNRSDVALQFSVFLTSQHFSLSLSTIQLCQTLGHSMNQHSPWASCIASCHGQPSVILYSRGIKLTLSWWHHITYWDFSSLC